MHVDASAMHAPLWSLSTARNIGSTIVAKLSPARAARRCAKFFDLPS